MTRNCQPNVPPVRQLAFLVCAIALISAACGNTSRQSVTIAVAVDNSQETAAIGRAVLFGAQYQARSAVAPSIVVLPFDDTNDPWTAKKGAVDLAAADVVAVIGHASSGITLAAEDVYGRFQIPLLMPVATHPGISSVASNRGWRNAFRLVPTHDLQATAIVDYALDRLLCIQPLIVNDASPYGVDLGQKLEQVFKSKEVNFAPRIPLHPVAGAGADYNRVIDNVERFEATCVVFAGYYEEASVLVHQIRATGDAIPILLTDGCFQADLFANGGPDIRGVFVAFVAPDWSRVEEARPLVKAFQEQFPEADPSYAPFGADAVRVVWQALANSRGEDSRKALLRALRSASFVVKGIAGEYHFNASGDAETGANYIYKVVETSGRRHFECVTCR